MPERYENLAARGLTSTIVADEVPPACHPLGPNNKLVIAPGIVTGTSAPTSGRLSVGYRGLSTTYGPTEMHRQSIQVGKAELAPIRAEIERYAEEVVPSLERALEGTGAPPIEG